MEVVYYMVSLLLEFGADVGLYLILQEEFITALTLLVIRILYIAVVTER